MRFGARAHSLEDVELLAGWGFDFAEVDWKTPEEAKGMLPALARLAERRGIAYLAHGPNEGNPFDADEIGRTLGPRVDELLDLADELGVSLYTQHLWLDPRFVGAETIARKIDLLGRWADRAASAGVCLCIENLSEHAGHLAAAFEQLPGLGLTLDVGHGEILSRPNASHGFIARFPERIRHVHLHDNRGGTEVKDDLHLPIGEGSIDFRAILAGLRSAGYAGGFSFELKPEHVKKGRAAIRRLWEGG